MNYSMIGELANGILSCLRHFYFHTGKTYLGITPSSVLYSYKKRKFSLLMSLGVKQGLLQTYKDMGHNQEELVNHWKLLRKRFWMDLFSLGLLIMNAIFGGTLDDISRLVGFSLSNLYNLYSFSNIPERCQEYCCLFHYVEEILVPDEQKYMENYQDYCRIYEIENKESLFLAIKRIKTIPKPLKDFLCNLTHLDFKNPSDFKDVLNHPYALSCRDADKPSTIKITSLGMPHLIDMSRIIRISARSAAGSYYFDGLVQAIEMNHKGESIYMTREEADDRIKKLSRELSVDRASVYAYLKHAIRIMKSRS